MMPGYCTHCGGTGFRNPAKEAERESAAQKFVEMVARLVPYDEDFAASDGCETANALIRDARKLRRSWRKVR
jgi:hypothetical protein